MRDLFPYKEVPRIDFDHQLVMPRPRGGHLDHRHHLPRRPAGAPALHRRTDRPHLRPPPPARRAQGRHPPVRVLPLHRRGPRGRGRCQELGYRFPEITGWIRAVAEDLQLVKEMGLKETGILTSVSDYHIFLKLNSNRKKALENYLAIVKAALETGITPRCHLEDITRADIYGFCRPLRHRADEASRREPGSPSRSGSATPWATASPTPARPCRAACPSWCGPDRRRRRPRRAAWNGTATTTSTRSWSTRPPPGSTAAPAPTAPSSASASAPATPPSRAWSSSTSA